MKTKKIIKPVIAIALFFFAAIALKGQEVRLFEKEIDASRGMTVSIENQFGDIECHTWNKNRIYVAVDVKGQLESEKRVKEKILKPKLKETSPPMNRPKYSIQLKFL